MLFLAIFIRINTCEIIDSRASFIPLQTFGIGPFGSLIINLNILPDCEFFSKTRTLFVVAESQYSITGISQEIYVPAYYMQNFDNQSVRATVTADDQPLLLSVYISNPQPSTVLQDADPEWPFWPLEIGDNRVRFYGEVKFQVRQASGTFSDFQYQLVPEVFQIMSLGLIFATLIYEILLISNYRKNLSVLHLLFLGILLLLSSFFYCYSYSKEYLRDIEEIDDASRQLATLVPQILQKIYEPCELCLYLLTAVGWKTVRRNELTDAERQFIGLIFVALLYIGLVEIDCESSDSCAGYRLSRVVISSVGFLAVVVGINYHVAMLTSQINESSIQQVGKLYQKRQAFARFRNLFLVYLLLPTLVLYYRVAVLSWQEDWAFLAVYWSARAILIYCLVLIFRPFGNSTLAIFDFAGGQHISAE